MSDKNLCDLAKKEYLDNHFSEYTALVRKGKYLCKKCGRVGVEKDVLCKPEKMSKKKSS